MFVYVLASPVKGEAGRRRLFNANVNYLWFVGILYRNVNWHGVLPFLFCFLFFHCGT